MIVGQLTNTRIFECTTASEFLNRLSPAREPFRSSYRPEVWLFRGQTAYRSTAGSKSSSQRCHAGFLRHKGYSSLDEWTTDSR
jgi:hypothetical protein